MRKLVPLLALTLLAGCEHRNQQEALGTLKRDRIVLKATADETLRNSPSPRGPW